MLQQGTAIVGRGMEQRAIRQLVDRLSAGSGHLLWFEGEPGIGKSTLLRLVRGAADVLGCETHWASGEEFTEPFPLRALLHCFDSAELQASPAPSALLPGDPVLHLVEAVIALVERRCAAKPVLLVVDDIQWADTSTLYVVERLARLVRQIPLLVAVGCRRPPRRDEVVRLRRAMIGQDALVHTLAPLTDDDTEALIAGVAAAASGPELRMLASSAGGNPLYAEELAGAYRGHRLAGVSPSLDAMIAERVSLLGQGTQDLLRTAALLGVEFRVTDLAMVTGREPTTMLAAFDEAVANDVVVEHGAGFAFRHGLIRQALYEGLPGGLRLALHQQTARALAEAGAPVERVAEHLVAAPDQADAWWAGWVARSAAELGQRAPLIAVDLLRRAIRADGVDADTRNRLEIHLASVMFQRGHYEEVDQIATRTAGIGWWWAYSLLRLSRYDDALDRIAEALDGADPAEAEASRLVALRAVVLANCGRYDEAKQAASELLGGAESDGFARAYALHALSVVAAHAGDHELTVVHIEDALKLVGEDDQTADLRVLLLANRASELGELDREREADVAVADMLAAAERMGAPLRLAMCRLTAAEHWFHCGRWDDALAELDVLDDELIDKHLAWRLRRHGVAATIACHRDDDAAVELHLRALSTVDIMAGDLSHSIDALLWPSALRAERAGDLAAAVDNLARMCESGLWRAIPELFRLDPEQSLPAPTGEPVSPTDHAIRSWCAGLRYGDADRLALAAHEYGAVGRLFERARVLEDRAVLLAGQGDVASAKQAHLAATEVYTQLGATWDIQRLGSRLRARGVRLGQRGSRTRPDIGWEALTQAELRIVRHVAQGMSNREIATTLFLSQRTVETHISRVLGKLNARSRVEIVREVMRQEAS